MKLLPRSLEYRTGDTPESVATRLAVWSRDVIAALRGVPDVGYVTVAIEAGVPADTSVTLFGTPRSVSIARVESGTITATPGLHWVPVAGGFRLVAIYGLDMPVTLSLRVEV